MDNYKTIVTELDGQVATLWLARPQVHNALNDIMIQEISDFFSKIESDNTIRLIVIRGQGKSFCSGADLGWMKKAITLPKEHNLNESEVLSKMFSLIFNSSKIVIAVAHGNVFGGGCGLVAACDLAYCVADTGFALSETRIGLAAASITPYLLNKVPSLVLKELIFSARNFDGTAAAKYGLLNHAFRSTEAMESYLNELVKDILANGPQAVTESKRIINRLTEEPKLEVMVEIPELLAQMRISNEAQEGFSAFLEKRKPKW